MKSELVAAKPPCNSFARFPPRPHPAPQQACLHVLQEVVAAGKGRLPCGVTHAAGQRGAALQVVQQAAAQPAVAAPPAGGAKQNRAPSVRQA
jgi:hypothetical protein